MRFWGNKILVEEHEKTLVPRTWKLSQLFGVGSVWLSIGVTKRLHCRSDIL